jgi:spore germination protein GerM
MGAKTKKNTSGIVAAVWVLSLVVLLMLAIMLWPAIRGVLKETGFFTKIGLTEPDFITNYEPSPRDGTNPQGVAAIGGAGDAGTEVSQVPVPPPTVQEKPAENAPNPAGETARTSGASLWFIEIDRDGAISRKEVRHELPQNNSPLTMALQNLLSGPSITDLEKGYVSLIPEGTKLRSVSIAGGVAALNFSEEFEYNRYGIEGYLGQLAQVVYTATAFPTVNSVQFVIEGQLKEYIGGEGIVWIGSPLSRESFR